MSKLTPKQEKFAQKYIETGNASEAYRQVYNADKMQTETIHVAASQLLGNHKVLARIETLQAASQKRHDVTIDSITTELEEAREIGKGEKQAGSMVQATMGKAKIHGLIVDRGEVSGDINITIKKYDLPDPPE